MASDAPVVLVTGGTGTLGRALLEAPDAEDIVVRVMSRGEAPGDLPAGREWARADLSTGEGVAEAVRGADVIIHAASDPRGDPVAVDVEGTARLLEAVWREGTAHVVYPSIVGIDRMHWGYYDAKVSAEALIAGSGARYTTVRITQFHSFVDAILSRVARIPPVMPLPARAMVQSIAVEEAAARVWALARGDPAGRAPDVGGPEVLALEEMARAWCRARRRRRWIVRLPLPWGLARGFRQGLATVPSRAVGRETWEEWLART